uniref:Uncharacterized protein n=1 Tax=Helianthus annuus TaxID=4232 RepID=A0A251TC41_HELAN
MGQFRKKSYFGSGDTWWSNTSWDKKLPFAGADWWGVFYVDIAGFEAWTYSRKCWYVGNIHIQMTGQFLQEVFAS